MKETLGIVAFSCLSLLTASAFAAAPAWLDVAVSAESANTVEMRRHLHANPELGNQEKQTQAYIVQKLKEFGVDEVLVGYKNSPTARSSRAPVRWLKTVSLKNTISSRCTAST